MNTYIIELQSDTPPRVFIGDSVAGGQVVAIKDNTPSLVDTKWLTNATGEVDDYDLQLSCLAPSENLVNEVIEAIKNGEDDDLYLEIRDTFDRLDCEDI